jgi:ATP/maltotriose-dependent transcriptional regulator MalT
MAEAQERSVNISEAIRTLREAQRLRDPAQNQLFSSNLDLFLASALFDNGQRLEAIQVCKGTIAQFTDLEGRVSPLATSMVSRLGLYLCEENLLDEALQRTRQGLELGHRLGIEGQLPVAYSALAHVLAARSEDQAAMEALDEACRLALKTALSDPQVHSAMKANIQIKQGNLPAARQWAEDAKLSLEEQPNHLRIDVQIVFARLLLAQGRSDEAGAPTHHGSPFASPQQCSAWRFLIGSRFCGTGRATGRTANVFPRLSGRR